MAICVKWSPLFDVIVRARFQALPDTAPTFENPSVLEERFRGVLHYRDPICRTSRNGLTETCRLRNDANPTLGTDPVYVIIGPGERVDPGAYDNSCRYSHTTDIDGACEVQNARKDLPSEEFMKAVFDRNRIPRPNVGFNPEFFSPYHPQYGAESYPSSSQFQIAICGKGSNPLELREIEDAEANNKKKQRLKERKIQNLLRPVQIYRWESNCDMATPPCVFKPGNEQLSGNSINPVLRLGNVRQDL